MELKIRNKKMVLYCSYRERDFPKFLGGRWSGALKGWAFSPSLMTYNAIIEKARSESISITIEPKIVTFFTEKMSKLDKFLESLEYKTTPYKHQESITSLIVNKRKCFIFAGVGTGKSKGAIDAVSYLWAKGEVKKVLVVSPASIMWNFGNEIKIHSDFDHTIIVGSLDKRKQLIEDSATVFDIINYEILGKLSDNLIKKKYDMVIFDEIHNCKSRTSIRAKASFKIASSIDIRVGLTGTIISNNYDDLFMPYQIIDPSVFGSKYTSFKNRYFIMGGYMAYEIVGTRNEREIKELVATNSIKFDIRDVMDNLPDEKNIIKTVHLNNNTKKLYKELKTHMMIENDRGDIEASNVLERMIRLSQITSGFLVDKENDIIDEIGRDKIEVLKETLSGITEKTVIFCRFRRSIDNVASLCDELGLSYYIYDGRTKEKDLYLKYNTDSTMVWIAQLQKSEGYSIPSAQYCIFYELDYSRKNHVQSRGRILRATGSKHTCLFYIYLLAENSIDEAVYKVLQSKDFNSKQALELVRGVE